jgi:glycine/sarcosine/dimethylglycine N-methyltransferase
MDEKIFLPGSGKQLEFTLKQVELVTPAILVIGSFSGNIAVRLADKYDCNVEIIVEDTESFLNTNLILSSIERVKTSVMSFSITDFDAASFDLVYAQASISNDRRNKIVKEIKRILKPGGYLSVGEIVKLKKEVPPFVDNIFSGSQMEPLFIEEIEDYYTKRNFTVVEEEDLTSTLREYYMESAGKLDEALYELSENEKKYNKKLLNKISHETNAYLKLGAEKFIGFKYLLLKKGEN